MLGFSLLAATALAGAAQGPAVPAAAPARALKDIPSVTITYYDVTGKNGDAIRKSMEKNAPRAPGSKEALAGTTNWTMKAEYTQRTTNGKCAVASAKANFQGTATLPRLTNEPTVNRELQGQWRAFIGGLETAAAADLGYAYDHAGDVEKAIVSATCETAGTAGSEAIAKLRQQASEYQRSVMAATKAVQPKNGSNASSNNGQGGEPVKPDSY